MATAAAEAGTRDRESLGAKLDRLMEDNFKRGLIQSRPG